MKARVCVVVAVVLSACSGGGGGGAGLAAKGPTFKDLPALASSLGCAGFQDTTFDSEGVKFGTDYSRAHGTCTVDGEATKFELYKDAGAQSNQEGLIAALGCSFAKSFGITQIVGVRGPLWRASPKTETEAKVIANRTGGEVKVTKCS